MPQETVPVAFSTMDPIMGSAIGAATDIRDSIVIAMAIAIHNIPVGANPF